MNQTAASITNHGAIVEMRLPDGFAAPKTSRQHNYLESKLANSSMARICYEEMGQPLEPDYMQGMVNLFQESLPENGKRQLDIYGESEEGPDDSEIYNALCYCFVFGGNLGREGSHMDMDESTWFIQRIGHGNDSKTMLTARLKFQSCSGELAKREALLVMPQPPGGRGSGYIWLEGTAQDITSCEAAFLKSIAEGKFKRLA